MAYLDQSHISAPQGQGDRFQLMMSSNDIPNEPAPAFANADQYTSSLPGLAHAIREISSHCGDMRLPKEVCALAQQIYKTIAKDGIVPSRRLIRPFGAACIFLACRYTGFDCTFRRIAKATGVKKTALGECYYALERKFNPNSSAADSPEDRVLRWAGALGLPASVEMACQFVVGAVSQHGIAKGRRGRLVAAGALYFTCRLLGLDVPACEIVRASGVGLSGLEGVYKCLYEEKQKLARLEWIMDGMADFDRLPNALV